MTTITKTQAEALFDNLSKALTDLDEAVLAIATTKAWVVLGYVSLGEAIGDRIADLRPGRRAALVSLMVSHDVPGTDVTTIKGVSPVTVLNAMRDVGKAPAQEPSPFSTPSRPYRISFEVDPEERANWVDIANATGESVHDVALRATRQAFNRLGSKVRA